MWVGLLCQKMFNRHFMQVPQQQRQYGFRYYTTTALTYGIFAWGILNLKKGVDPSEPYKLNGKATLAALLPAIQWIYIKFYNWLSSANYQQLMEKYNALEIKVEALNIASESEKELISAQIKRLDEQNKKYDKLSQEHDGLAKKLEDLIAWNKGKIIYPPTRVQDCGDALGSTSSVVGTRTSQVPKIDMKKVGGHNDQHSKRYISEGNNGSITTRADEIVTKRVTRSSQKRER